MEQVDLNELTFREQCPRLYELFGPECDILETDIGFWRDILEILDLSDEIKSDDPLYIRGHLLAAAKSGAEDLFIQAWDKVMSMNLDSLEEDDNSKIIASYT